MVRWILQALPAQFPSRDFEGPARLDNLSSMTIQVRLTDPGNEQTRNVIGVVYATTRAIDRAELQSLADQFARLLTTLGGAESIETHVVGPAI